MRGFTDKVYRNILHPENEILKPSIFFIINNGFSELELSKTDILSFHLKSPYYFLGTYPTQMNNKMNLVIYTFLVFYAVILV